MSMDPEIFPRIGRRSALLALAAAAAALTGARRTGAAAERGPLAAMGVMPVEPPEPAPDIVFRTLDDAPARLDVFRGRAVLLTFFATW